MIITSYINCRLKCLIVWRIYWLISMKLAKNNQYNIKKQSLRRNKTTALKKLRLKLLIVKQNCLTINCSTQLLTKSRRQNLRVYLGQFLLFFVISLIMLFNLGFHSNTMSVIACELTICRWVEIFQIKLLWKFDFLF